MIDSVVPCWISWVIPSNPLLSSRLPSSRISAITSYALMGTGDLGRLGQLNLCALELLYELQRDRLLSRVRDGRLKGASLCLGLDDQVAFLRGGGWDGLCGLCGWWYGRFSFLFLLTGDYAGSDWPVERGIVPCSVRSEGL